MANDDQAKGAAEKIKGKIKETVGKAIGNKDMEAEGKAEKAEGDLQKTKGDAKDKI